MLSLWLGDLDSTNEVVRFAAENALRQIGPPAVPHLRSLLRVESPFTETLKSWAGRLPLVHYQFVPAYIRQRQALRAARLLGTQAHGVLPELKKLLTAALVTASEGRPAHPFEIIDTLAALGPEAEPVLTIALTNNDSSIRWMALLPLARAASISSNTLPALLQVLNESEPPVRELAVQTLGRGAVPPAQILPILQRFQSDPDENVRHAAHDAMIRVMQPRASVTQND